MAFIDEVIAALEASLAEKEAAREAEAAEEAEASPSFAFGAADDLIELLLVNLTPCKTEWTMDAVLIFVKPSKEQRAEWKRLAENANKQLVKNGFNTQKMFTLVNKLITEHNKNKQNVALNTKK